MKVKTSIALAFITLLSFFGGVPAAVGAEDGRSTLMRVVRDKPQVSEDDRYLLEVAPCYYKYKTNEKDWLSAGLLFQAVLAPEWEISIGGDLLSYQDPDLGLGDLYVGAKWTFYDRNDFTMAVSTYVLFPTGHQALREPGIEPTLTLLLGRRLGDWEISMSIGSTYAADEQGDPNYLDVELSLEADYALDEKNSFGVFAAGYGPDQRTDGSSRVSVGASYTRTFTDHQSVGLLFAKGLSDRGMDWSGTLIYRYTF